MSWAILFSGRWQIWFLKFHQGFVFKSISKNLSENNPDSTVYTQSIPNIISLYLNQFIYLKYLWIKQSISIFINNNLCSQLEATIHYAAITHGDIEEVTANNPNSEYMSKWTYTKLTLTLLDFRHERWTWFTRVTASGRASVPSWRGPSQIVHFTSNRAIYQNAAQARQ